MKKLLFRGALALAFITMLAPAQAQQVWKWSQTPSSNNTADPSINWSVGMAPSAVSPSARAMMAGVARYRDDTSGRLITGGTSTAYTISSNSSYASPPADGTRISAIVHLTNGVSPTLAVDGGSALPIQVTSTTAVPAATLISGTPYDFVLANGIWTVVGVTGTPTTIPIGGLIDYAGTTAPNSNFALTYGQAISRTTYSGLFALVGTTFGPGDGTTTFNLPDLRGRVVAGQDNMGGSAAGRITFGGGNFDATVFGAVGGLQNHTLSMLEIPTFTPAGSISSFNPASFLNSFTPAGSVGITDPGHVHNINTTSVSTTSGGGAASDLSGSANTRQTVSNTTGITASFSGNSVTLTGSNITPTFTGTTVGGGFAHPILPPMMILGKIIRIF